MVFQKCPKCGTDCEVSEKNTVLGIPIECLHCKCKFEVLPKGLSEKVPSFTLKAVEATSSPDTTKNKTTAYNPAENTGSVKNATIADAPKTKKVNLGLFAKRFLIVLLIIISICSLWQWNWFTIVHFASLTMMWVCFEKRKTWKERNSKSLWYFLYDKGVELLVPLTAVTAFYTLLSVLVENTADTITYSWLEKLDAAICFLNDKVYYIKFKPWTVAAIIFGLMIVDAVLSYFITVGSLASNYKHYSKWSKRVITTVALLGSFTFFGTFVGGEKVARLRLSQDKIRKTYASVQQHAEQMLFSSVQQDLYQKVLSSFPDEVIDAGKTAGAINDALSTFEAKYNSAKDYGLYETSAESIHSRYFEKSDRVSFTNTDPIPYAEEVKTAPTTETAKTSGLSVGEAKPVNKVALSELSVESASKVATEIETTATSRSRFVSLLKLDGTKQLLVQFPKSLTSATKTKIFAGVTKEFPILEHFIDVFVGAFDKQLEDKVNKSVDRVAEKLLKNPQAANQIISEESGKITESVKVSVSGSTITKARAIAGKVKAQIAEIQNAIKRLTTLIANRESKIEASPFNLGDWFAFKGDQFNKPTWERPDIYDSDPMVTCTCTCPGKGILWVRKMTLSMCRSSCSGPC